MIRDIRQQSPEIKAIRYMDGDQSTDCGTVYPGKGHESTMVFVCDHEDDVICIKDKNDAMNLVKAIEEAIRLGWVR